MNRSSESSSSKSSCVSDKSTKRSHTLSSYQMEQDNEETEKVSKKQHRVESKSPRDKSRRIPHTESSQQMVQESKKVPKKRLRVGRITRNPFLNFLREFRMQNDGLGIIASAEAAGAIWRNMTQDKKEPYRKQAENAPKSSRTYKDY
ncbi:hypothetical protein ILUMI_04265 [Ignelater luminosus]|uniref:HMG box domain-containing protein n=1 Tax=Ignelater luminosus TaxID=2038154 RepID=A0A8K0GEQ5_IGNLU|nr:hypothetical protein ILUMI_04265 [Ignelater luminosus]